MNIKDVIDEARVTAQELHRSLDARADAPGQSARSDLSAIAFEARELARFLGSVEAEYDAVVRIHVNAAAQQLAQLVVDRLLSDKLISAHGAALSLARAIAAKRMRFLRDGP